MVNRLTFYLLLLVTALAGCNSAAEQTSEKTVGSTDTVPEKNRISIAGAEGGGVILFHGKDDAIHAAWLEKDETTQKWNMKAATFNPNKNSFGPVSPVSPATRISFSPEATPKIAVKKDGTWVLLFSENVPGSASVYREIFKVSRSTDNGKTWTLAQPLSPELYTDQSEEFADMEVLPDGEIGCTWLMHEGDDSVSGSTLLYSRTEPGAGFGKQIQLATNTCECCPTDLAVSDSGAVYVAWRGITDEGQRNIQIIASSDGGQRFSARAAHSGESWALKGCPVSGAALAPISKLFTHMAFYSGGMTEATDGPSGLWFASYMTLGPMINQTALLKISPAGKHPRMVPLGLTEEKFAQSLLVWDEKTDGGNQAVFAVAVGAENVTTTPSVPALIVSDKGAQAHHPAVIAIAPGRALVMWTQKTGDGWPGVYWKVIENGDAPVL